MSKILTSPVKKYAGTVTVYDPLNPVQYLAYEEVLYEAKEIDRPTKFAAKMLPGIFVCIETMDIPALAGVTAETFPMTPITPALEFVSWLVVEMNKIIFEQDVELPNE